MHDWRDAVRTRLSGAGLDGATEREVIEELAQHAEDRFADLVAHGVGADAALRAVMSELDDEGIRRISRPGRRGAASYEPPRHPSPDSAFARVLSELRSDLRY